MLLRLLIATPDEESLGLIHSILDSALCLTPLDVVVAEVRSCATLKERIEMDQDDIILLDWQIAGSETPSLVQEVLNHNPLLRVVVLLPEHYRQYRQLIWNAGACNGIPKEHMDQEWLSTVLCIMYRAMQREAKFLAEREGEALNNLSTKPTEST
jgi:DNA-binding NarL/FixJ family response regulator